MDTLDYYLKSLGPDDIVTINGWNEVTPEMAQNYKVAMGYTSEVITPELKSVFIDNGSFDACGPFDVDGFVNLDIENTWNGKMPNCHYWILPRISSYVKYKINVTSEMVGKALTYQWYIILDPAIRKKYCITPCILYETDGKVLMNVSSTYHGGREPIWVTIPTAKKMIKPGFDDQYCTKFWNKVNEQKIKDTVPHFYSNADCF